MSTTTPFTRYDLCPKCSTRLDMKQFEVEDKDVKCTLLLNGKVERAVLCNNCNYLFTKQRILDYWTNYSIDKALD